MRVQRGARASRWLRRWRSVCKCRWTIANTCLRVAYRRGGSRRRDKGAVTFRLSGSSCCLAHARRGNRASETTKPGRGSRAGLRAGDDASIQPTPLPALARTPFAMPKSRMPVMRRMLLSCCPRDMPARGGEAAGDDRRRFGTSRRCRRPPGVRGKTGRALGFREAAGEGGFATHDVPIDGNGVAADAYVRSERGSHVPCACHVVEYRCRSRRCA